MLYINFLKIDWLYVDSIIISLLILLLISVKIFKEKSRWRLSFSNNALNQIKIRRQELIDNKFLSIKKCSILQNMSFLIENRPKLTIVLINTKFKTKIPRLLTDGLCNYGFDVVNLTLNHYREKTISIMQEKIENPISKILNYLLKKEYILNEENLSIIYSKSGNLIQSILSSSNDNGNILINPKIDNSFIKYILKFSNDNNSQIKLNIIYSKKSHLIFPNIDLKKFLKKITDYQKKGIKLSIIKKSQTSFKYHETILLGIIIEFLELNL